MLEMTVSPDFNNASLVDIFILFLQPIIAKKWGSVNWILPVAPLAATILNI
jgi:hypothetical protein